MWSYIAPNAHKPSDLLSSTHTMKRPPWTANRAATYACVRAHINAAARRAHRRAPRAVGSRAWHTLTARRRAELPRRRALQLNHRLWGPGMSPL